MEIKSKWIVAIAILLTVTFLLTLTFFMGPFLQPHPSVRNISANIAYAYIKEGWNQTNMLVLDVRTWLEYNASHIKGGAYPTLEAINIPYDQLLANLSRYGTPDCPLSGRKNDLIIVYCASGHRSTNACETLVNNPYVDFSNVNNMVGGFQEYYLKTLANPLQANPDLSATWDYSDTVVVNGTAPARTYQCTTITARDAYLMITSGSPEYGFCNTIVDVRASALYEACHIVNSTVPPTLSAINIPWATGAELLPSLAPHRNEPIILYCNSNCGMSASACQYLASLGFSKTYIINGGIDAWTSAGCPTATIK